MATAPTPGVSRRSEAQRTALKIKCDDGEWTLHMSDLGPRDDIEARKATGLPVTPYFNDERFGMDSLLIIMWIARRKAGEPRLRFDDVMDEFPTYESLTEKHVEIEAVELDGDDTDDDGVDFDPLPSGATSST